MLDWFLSTHRRLVLGLFPQCLTHFQYTSLTKHTTLSQSQIWASTLLHSYHCAVAQTPYYYTQSIFLLHVQEGGAPTGCDTSCRTTCDTFVSTYNVQQKNLMMSWEIAQEVWRQVQEWYIVNVSFLNHFKCSYKQFSMTTERLVCRGRPWDVAESLRDTKTCTRNLTLPKCS